MNRQRIFILAAAIIILTVTPGLILHLASRSDSGNSRSRIVVTPLEAVSSPTTGITTAVNVDPPVTKPQQVRVVPIATDTEPAGLIEVASDEAVRALAAGLSSRPDLARWLVNDDLIRRFAAAVNMVAGGYSPREQLGFLRPLTPFVVQRRAAVEQYESVTMIIGPGSFRRYDVAAEAVESIDVAGMVALYRYLEADIKAVYREISWYGPPFEERLLEAIDHLLDVDPPEGDMVVTAGTLTWSYTDEGLEGLSDAQRHFLRTGPRNMRRIQSKLRHLRHALQQPSSAADPAGLEPSLQAALLIDTGEVLLLDPVAEAQITP